MYLIYISAHPFPTLELSARTVYSLVYALTPLSLCGTTCPLLSGCCGLTRGTNQSARVCVNKQTNNHDNKPNTYIFTNM